MIRTKSPPPPKPLADRFGRHHRSRWHVLVWNCADGIAGFRYTATVDGKPIPASPVCYRTIEEAVNAGIESASQLCR